jgi:hypothetical protein
MDGMGTGLFVSQQYGYFVAELYHLERNHQGLGNGLIVPIAAMDTTGTIERRQRLGGLLNYYFREAA